jgi:hypothetical protein
MFESIHHLKKNTTMAKPNAGFSGIAIVINSCPPGLFAMGWSRAQTKDFIQLSKPAKKIINFVKASILF